MDKEKTSEKYLNSKPKECSICKKPLPRDKLIFSSCYNGWICFECYKNQFKSTPIYPKPVFIKPREIKVK